MNPMSQAQLRHLASVDALLQDHTLRDFERRYGHAIVVAACRRALDAARASILAGADAPMPALLIDDIRERIERAVRPSLVPVINATGVILHTNLGRAPLSEDTLAAMRAAAQGYSNLEYDLAAGERGSRHAHAESFITRLTGAEAALVVNNNAAAVMLILAAFARGKEAIVSRGQLVEIGGGFRIPEVMLQSGALLVEVGTTNRTYLQDYARAITDATALLLRVHSSNFKVIGFTHEATLEELAALAHEKGLLLADDLGSGALIDTSAYGLAHEPMPQESLAAGADLVSFSGDKLLGGPQAGIIIGKQSAIDVLKKHPLTRALRVDKVTLAGVQATLLHYLKDEAAKKIPVWSMIAAKPDALDARAQKWAGRLRAARLDAVVIDAESTVGGGSLPGETLPTRAVALAIASPDEFAARLRQNVPPIVARIEEGRVVFDPRTVLAAEEDALLAGIERVPKIRGV
ncbi:MAG: L-seryl-tRNA(Sec) selenium transferase [Chloroflexota bacterium]|nr:L-seryl-tRNA(Sec) selenium transferase [Chloroflexota bacterium]